MQYWLYDQSAIQAVVLGQVKEACVKSFPRGAIHSYSSVTGMFVLHHFRRSYGGAHYESLKQWIQDRQPIPFDLAELGLSQFVDAFSIGPHDREQSAVFATAILLWSDKHEVTIVTTDRTRYSIDPDQASVFELELKH
jgi:hypothetical protein